MQKAMGFLMLDTRFPRIIGDAGCADTWPFPVLYEVVRGASPVCAVHRGAAGLLPALIDGGRNLISRGARGIATTCGFLCLHQQELAAALPVPVCTSALLCGGRLQSELPSGKQLGILTASPAHLSSAHLSAAGIDETRAVIGGLPPDCSFAQTLLQNKATLDIPQAEQDMRQAAKALCARAPIGILLLECTNMPPYSQAVEDETGIKTFSITDAVAGFYDTL